MSMLGTRCLGLVLLCSVARAALPEADSAAIGMDPQRLARIDALVAQGLEAGEMAGCVVCVGRQGRIAFLKAYGDRQVEPQREAMTADTVFDLASITKPVATATSIMVLVEQGRLRLQDRVAQHLPEFGQKGKETITVEDLLLHQGGLIPDNSLGRLSRGQRQGLAARLCPGTAIRAGQPVRLHRCRDSSCWVNSCDVCPGRTCTSSRRPIFSDRSG